MGNAKAENTGMVVITMLDMESIWDYVIAVVLAAAGGLARLLNLKSRRNLNRGRVFSEIFISGFAGLMVLLLARAGGLTGDWLGLVCGMAGWIGPRILDLVAKPATNKAGIELESKKK